MTTEPSESGFFWPSSDDLPALLPSIRDLWALNDVGGIDPVSDKELEEWVYRQEFFVAVEPSVGTARKVIGTLRLVVAADPPSRAKLTGKIPPPSATALPVSVETFDGQSLTAATSVEQPFQYRSLATPIATALDPVFLYFGTIFIHPNHRSGGLGNEILKRGFLHHFPAIVNYSHVDKRDVTLIFSTTQGPEGDRIRLRNIRIYYLFSFIVFKSYYKPPRTISHIVVSSWGIWSDHWQTWEKATAVTMDRNRHATIDVEDGEFDGTHQVATTAKARQVETVAKARL
ncbi:hypothetical protein BC937DRAFT_87515 [Endogone sp. FLAS-F59071]|nr:hypothetical protein BC937DRAFT_87515 [Endogone sp. FLAS-F59071]|eukprot:RUS19422.1 hypothetical protein BC937DRAFT_87515 [Endogone sp. FLAS-F59071]